MSRDPVDGLERNAWSMFSFMGRGHGGRVIDSPTRLVIESPVQRPPYNGIWRFYDESDRPVQQQAEEFARSDDGSRREPAVGGPPDD